MRLSLYWILVFLAGSCLLLELESTTPVCLILFPMEEHPCFKMDCSSTWHIDFSALLDLYTFRTSADCKYFL